MSVQVSHRGNVWSDKKPRKNTQAEETAHCPYCSLYPLLRVFKTLQRCFRECVLLFLMPLIFPPQVLKSDPRLWDVNQLHPVFLKSMCSTPARDRMSTCARLEALVMYIDMHVNAIYRQMCIGRHAYIGYMQVYMHTQNAVCTWNESRKIPLMLQSTSISCKWHKSLFLHATHWALGMIMRALKNLGRPRLCKLGCWPPCSCEWAFL